MFRVELAVPKKWIEADPNCEIHFIWAAGCEASLYNPKTGMHLQAITENVREVYHIKDGRDKNDLEEDGIVVSQDAENITVCYILEMACQEMFGNFTGWGGTVDMDKMFELKKCQIGLFNPKIDAYCYDIEMIKDAAKLLDKKQSTRAHEYLNFVYDMASKYLVPLSDSELDEALKETREFIASHKNSSQ